MIPITLSIAAVALTFGWAATLFASLLFNSEASS